MFCCKRFRPPSRAVRWFAKMVIGVLKKKRAKQLWHETGIFLQKMKRKGLTSQHLVIVGKRWGAMGSKLHRKRE